MDNDETLHEQQEFDADYAENMAEFYQDNY